VESLLYIIDGAVVCLYVSLDKMFVGAASMTGLSGIIASGTPAQAEEELIRLSVIRVRLEALEPLAEQMPAVPGEPNQQVHPLTGSMLISMRGEMMQNLPITDI